jgi:hypothetical protein
MMPTGISHLATIVAALAAFGAAAITALFRSLAASRARAEMRATQLAHEAPDRLAHRWGA